MPLTPAQLTALKSEFANDPRGYAYAQYWTTTPYDNALRDYVNDVRDGTPYVVGGISIPLPTNPTGDGGAANGVIRINNLVVDTAVIRSTVTLAAFGGLVTVNQQYLQWVASAGLLTINAALLQNFAGIPTATGSIWAVSDRAAMNAAFDAVLRKNASRAEEKFGFGVVVTSDDVSAARKV